MKYELEFDKRLLNKGLEAAYDWSKQALEEEPENQNLRDLAMFAAVCLRRKGVPDAWPEAPQRHDSDSQWIKAAAFIALKTIPRDQVPYFMKGPERLRLVWILRFYSLGQNDAARRLCRLIMVYGSEFERGKIREFMFEDRAPDDVM